MPGVAVIMPFRNTADWIEESVRSAMQSEVNLLVAVDDASTDASPEIAQRVQQDYPDRMEVYRLPVHENQYAAMNLGVVRALQLKPAIDYIAFLDSDDVARQSRFLIQTGLLDEDPKRMVVGGPTIEIDAHGNELRDGGLALELLDDPLPTLLRRFGIGLWTCTAMYRREVFEALGGFVWTPTMGDTDFAVRTAFWCGIHGYSMHNDRQPVNLRRIHRNQVQQTTGSSKAPYKIAFERFLQQKHAYFGVLYRQGLLQDCHLHHPNPWVQPAWPTAPSTTPSPQDS